MTLHIQMDLWILGCLLFLRSSALFFSLPFFGDAQVPNQVKILLSCCLSFFFFPIVQKTYKPDHFSFDVFWLFEMALKEIAFGLTLGWLTKLTFESLVMAAHLAGFQMGFGSSSLMFPGMDSGSHSFAFFHKILVVLIFLSLDLHHIFLDALFKSFEYVPLGRFFLSDLMGEFFIQKTSQILFIALKLASPMTVALLFAMSALGLVARAVPQINIFSVSFTVNFFLGLGTYLSMMPFLPSWLKDYYLKEAVLWLNLISSWKGP